MGTTTTPNMGMILPIVLSELGPAWASELIAALTARVDAHDHTAGKGVTLQTSSIAVNADFPFVSFNATQLRSARFTQQASALVLGSDVGCLYDVLGNLFWNNAAGTPVQLTNGASVNSASALTGPVTGTQRTVATTYAVDSITADFELFVDTTGGAFTITLPVPTAGRQLLIVDSKGNFATAALTISPHTVEKINGLAATRLLTAAWAQYEVSSNGTDWFLVGN
jgi:hypothetical protein